MKVALVHDYLAEYGGAERVVEALHEIWPEAPLYTAFIDRKRLGKHADRFAGWDIRPSWLQSTPLVQKLISPLRFVGPWVWRSFDFAGFDVVITSSGWFIPRGIIVTKPTRHICYIHHPPRNLYGYATGSNLQKYWPVKLYTVFINFFLRHYDFRTAQTVDLFIANSKETQLRVKKFYRRDSVVVYPPIRLPKKKAEKPSGATGYYLSVGRLSFAKRIDLIIEACNALGRPLKIVGVGGEADSLKRIAGPTVEFLGSVSDTQLAKLYAGAKALIFCALDEDFGMVPVEAMAAGTPVIAPAQGGVKETVLDGKTGVLFQTPDASSIRDAIVRFEQLSKNQRWVSACMRRAGQFSEERFKSQIRQLVDR